MFGICEAMNGTEIDELLQTRERRHQRVCEKVLRRCRSLRVAGSWRRRQESERLKDKRRRMTRKEYQRLLSNFEMKVSWRKKGLWNLVREKVPGQRSVA